MEQIILDISNLPEKARNELKDFYEFLLMRYSLPKERKEFNFINKIPRKVNTFIPLKRENIYER